MSKKRKGHGEEEHENLERWLITYADMITLLMAFFIMMYAMSVVNKGKFAALAVSVRTGFGGPVPGALPDVLNLREHTIQNPGAIEAADFELLSLADKFIKKNIAKGTDFREPSKVGVKGGGEGGMAKELAEQVQVVARGEDMVVRLSAGRLLFPRGSAELTAGAKKILDAVADLLAYVPNDVRVEGHTCDLPIHTARYPSNWELSAQRAINVLTYLVHKGIDPSRLSAVGYADTRPLVPNIDEEHRRKNRRVDIVLRGALSPETEKEMLRRFGVSMEGDEDLKVELQDEGVGGESVIPDLTEEIMSGEEPTVGANEMGAE